MFEAFVNQLIMLIFPVKQECTCIHVEKQHPQQSTTEALVDCLRMEKKGGTVKCSKEVHFFHTGLFIKQESHMTSL